MNYSNSEVKPPTPYFDYVLLFGALLVISIFTYVLIQYNLVEQLIEWSSLLSAILFFYLAFRYDHRGVLAMAITAFVGFWGLSLSPINWANSDLLETVHLYNSGILIGILLVITGFILDSKNIKKHFVFTFKNFGLILFLVGISAGMFESNYWVAYAIGSIISSAIISITSWKKLEHLFFVYAAITGYIAFTWTLIRMDLDVVFQLWFFYVMASMAGLIWMIERIINSKRKNRNI